ncbi:MAG: hypothetical protein JXA69_15695 [Phycisphaerae bacterium]|nr:hypothetical protein [Phycisphaerae bacterium]
MDCLSALGWLFALAATQTTPPATQPATQPANVHVELVRIEEHRVRIVRQTKGALGPAPNLILRFDLSGRQARNTTRVRDLKITTAVTDDGQSLVPESLPQRDYALTEFDRLDSRDGFQIDLPLLAPRRSAKTIIELDASCEIRTAGRVETIRLDGVRPVPGALLEHEALARARVAIHIVETPVAQLHPTTTSAPAAPRTLSIEVASGDASVQLELHDEAGTPVALRFRPSVIVEDDKTVWTFRSRDPLPAVVSVAVHLTLDQAWRTVPIRARDVELP